MVSACALTLVVFLLVSIVPQFEVMYAQMHVPLPALTVILIHTASLLRHPGIWISIASAAALAAGFGRAYARESAGFCAQSLAMRIPPAAAIMRKAELARIARTLGMLLSSGAGVVTALQCTEEAAGALYRGSIRSMRSALAQGSSLSAYLSGTTLYEPMFVQMVLVGEETGALDSLLLAIADHYETDVDAALTALAQSSSP